jgi:hypothetical protein
VSINETLVEAKMCTITLESSHFIVNKCPICTHNGAVAKFSTKSHETDYTVGAREEREICLFEDLLVNKVFIRSKN